MATRAFDRAQAWSELSEKQRDQASLLARALKESGLITDRTHHLLVYPQSFVCESPVAPLGLMSSGG
jgi:hypothetical protein